MQITATEDVAAPVDHVFSELTSFEVLERYAMRRGIEVQRRFKGDLPTAGEGWMLRFAFRGKEREASIVLEEYRPFDGLRFGGRSGGLETDTLIELVPLSPSRTRVNLVFKMTPKTLSARLLVQSFKLARSSINRRVQKRMAQYRDEIEARLARSA
ncbi:SRPBCC family protein [Marivita sp. GX14005]|uniref:SRPBCC family protein n=1 Tax=Marivita sp. GX14005 TaxID=2942276 RepID=UPI0020189C7C|nr:SRPBCC family protein [Marivita sp. GX14005]MCL3880997.1 SRPBCC family protein [Marivita sp. GX14005]